MVDFLILFMKPLDHNGQHQILLYINCKLLILASMMLKWTAMGPGLIFNLLI
jgi:hypothetical protein